MTDDAPTDTTDAQSDDQPDEQMISVPTATADADGLLGGEE